MSVDYIVSSLLPLAFGAPPPYTWEQFTAMAGEVVLPARWLALKAEILNAIAEERARSRGDGSAEAAAKWRRATASCSLYWVNRARAAFAEKYPWRRDEAIDRVLWDAAGELTAPASPLSLGALQTYAIRLALAIKRAKYSAEAGNAVLDRITAGKNDLND